MSARALSVWRSFITLGLKNIQTYFSFLFSSWLSCLKKTTQKTDTLRNFLASGKNSISLSLKKANTPPRLFSCFSVFTFFFPLLQVLLHTCCACIPSTAVAQLQSLCWHLDTEPVTLLSHCGLQLGQVRTARSWSFGFVTIGTAGAHLVRGGRQRLAHRDEVVGGGGWESCLFE